jgi:hypothetical protein
MAELEIHHEVHSSDAFSRTIGVVAAVLGVLLGIVTIVSHRAHTEGVLLKAEENDQWSLYQARRIKLHNVELGEDILHALPAPNAELLETLARYGKSKGKYEKESEETKKDAEKLDAASKLQEEKALRYDFGEGLLEIGLVLTSLYFISKSKLFPLVGIVSAALGVIAALSGRWL